MFEYKKVSNDKEKTSDQNSTTQSVNHPLYLDTVKQNLEKNLPLYRITIICNQAVLQQDQLDNPSQYSLIIRSQRLYHQKYQLLTQSLLNQSTYSFYVKHLVTMNHRPVTINDKLSVLSSINFVNKINKFIENLKIIIQPVSGKVYLQTKSFIYQSSLSHLKKHISKQDCFYTEVIFHSVKKAQRYIDLVLFLIGEIQLSDLLKNEGLKKEFLFLEECFHILQKLEKSVALVGVYEVRKEMKMRQNVCSKSFSSKCNAKYPSYHNMTQHQVISNHHQQQPIINHSLITSTLQFFTDNTQKTLDLFTHKNLYSNIDLSFTPFRTNNSIQLNDKTVFQSAYQRPSNHNKRILTYIEVVNVEKPQNSEDDEQDGWKLLSQGGFGIIQLGTVRYKNLSASYKQPDSSYSMLVKQQLIRKLNKHQHKNKIARQRKILQKLQTLVNPNIMNFYISFQFEYQNCIFAQYTPNLSLDLYVEKNRYSLSFGQKLGFLLQAMEGLIFLHAEKILHLDIKPGNMLISKHLKVQLSDFGEAFLIEEENMVKHQHAYTVPYCAPEIFGHQPQLTTKVDVYAIGVCIIKIVLGEIFLETFLRRKFIKRLCQREIENLGIGERFQKSFLSPVFNIILFVAYKAVNEDSTKRPSLEWIREILKHCREYILALIY